MKSLTTCCLPEMANHGSIKIRVGKEAEAFQRGTELKNDSSLPFLCRKIKKYYRMRNSQRSILKESSSVNYKQLQP